MSSEARVPGLIQRAADHVRSGGSASLVEKAAKRIAASGMPQPVVADAAAAPAAPVVPVEPAPSEPAATPTPPAPPTAEAATEVPQAAVEKPRPVVAEAPRPVLPRRSATEGADSRRADIVHIDQVRLQLAGCIVPSGERTRIVEEFRIVKRPLLLKAFATGDQRTRNGNLIMVTSARPGEGKSHTAVNLAMSMVSERDLNVLLVDADMHNTGEHSAMGMMGVNAEKGLLNVVADPSTDLADVLLRTDIPNLTLLPAGTNVMNPTELLASNRMGQLVEELAERYPDRVIIIDTPPVLATSEPSVLAMHVGQLLFVVEAEKTSQKAIESALALLGGCQNINLMLNKAKMEVGGDRFGAYSYYY